MGNANENDPRHKENKSRLSSKIPPIAFVNVNNSLLWAEIIAEMQYHNPLNPYNCTVKCVFKAVLVFQKQAINTTATYSPFK